MEDQEKLYKAGFNSGYLLAKYEPELASKILDSVRSQNNDYCVGLSIGHDTYVIDKMMEQSKANVKDVNTRGKDKVDREREE